MQKIIKVSLERYRTNITANYEYQFQEFELYFSRRKYFCLSPPGIIKMQVEFHGKQRDEKEVTECMERNQKSGHYLPTQGGSDIG